MKNDNFDIKDIKKVEEAKNKDEAVKMVRDILFNSSAGISKRPMHQARINYLTNRLKKQKDKNGVVSILYNMYLSGEDLGVRNSWYQTTIPGYKR
jgi:hypothetical protein